MGAVEMSTPADATSWWQKSHLVRLNFCILSLVLFCMTSPPTDPLSSVCHLANTWPSQRPPTATTEAS